MKPIFYSNSCSGKDHLPFYLKPGETMMITGAYCHGKLQKEIGYDICYVPCNGIAYDAETGLMLWLNERARVLGEIPKGKYECIVKANLKEYNAIAYIWDSTIKDRDRVMGLIVLADDEESVKYAESEMAKKSQVL